MSLENAGNMARLSTPVDPELDNLDSGGGGGSTSNNSRNFKFKPELVTTFSDLSLGTGNTGFMKYLALAGITPDNNGYIAMEQLMTQHCASTTQLGSLNSQYASYYKNSSNSALYKGFLSSNYVAAYISTASLPYKINGASVSVVLPGTTPQFDTCLYDGANISDTFKITRTPESLQITTRDESYTYYTCSKDEFPNNVVPLKVIFVLQGGGGSGGDSGFSHSGAGGGSGGFVAGIIDFSEHIQSDGTTSVVYLFAGSVCNLKDSSDNTILYAGRGDSAGTNTDVGTGGSYTNNLTDYYKLLDSNNALFSGCNGKSGGAKNTVGNNTDSITLKSNNSVPKTETFGGNTGGASGGDSGGGGGAASMMGNGAAGGKDGNGSSGASPGAGGGGGAYNFWSPTSGGSGAIGHMYIYY